MHLNNTHLLVTDNPSNEQYHNDIKHTIKYPQFFLQVLGVWPLILKDSTKKQKCFSALSIIICAISLMFVILPPSIDLIIRKNDPTSWIAIFTVIIYYSSSFLRLILFTLHYKTIRICLEHVKNDWMMIESDNDRLIMMKSVKFGQNLTVNCCLVTSVAFFIFLVIKPIWLGKIVNEYNVTIRTVAVPGFDLIFDLQSSRTYAIIFCANCFSGFVSYSAINASCSFTAAFVSHACGQIQVIVRKLETLIDSIDDYDNCDHLRDRLTIITRCHVRVLSFSSRIEEAVRELCFVEVISATLIICTIEYYLVMERSSNNPSGMLSYLLGFVSSSLNILLFCYIGELLKEQGHQIGRAASMIEWYRLSQKTAQDLMMIIIMDNYPPNITAGRIFELSIASFGVILRTSLTYCNMLRAIT